MIKAQNSSPVIFLYCIPSLFLFGTFFTFKFGVFVAPCSRNGESQSWLFLLSFLHGASLVATGNRQQKQVPRRHDTVLLRRNIKEDKDDKRPEKYDSTIRHKDDVQMNRGKDRNLAIILPGKMNKVGTKLLLNEKKRDITGRECENLLFSMIQ